MRILIVGHALRGGGAEFVTREWAGALASSGHSVAVMVLDRELEMPVAAAYEKIRPRGNGRIGHLRRILAVRNALKSGGFDVCLAMQTYPSIVALASRLLLRSPIPLVVSERNVPSVLLRNEGLGQRVQYAVTRVLYPRASAAIAISHPVAADLIGSRRIARDRCYVVPNPALAKVELAELGAPSTAEIVGSERRICIVMPFRLAPQKQPLRAIEVAQELTTRGFAVKVVSFGAGPLAQEVAACAKSASVDFEPRGWDEAWYAACPPYSVVLLPSLCEGFGNVLVEAAASGLPSVAPSSALGVADAIIPNVTGVLAMTDATHDLANAVVAARKLEVAAPRGWLSYFSLESSVAKLLEVFARLVDSPDHVTHIGSDGGTKL